MPSQFDQNHIFYQQYFRFPGRSVWMEKIWKEAFGPQYPEGLDHFAYLTQHDLEMVSQRLELDPGSILVDMGCGRGGPGMRVAERLQLQLTGVDIIPEAVEAAKAFQSAFDLLYPAEFKVGEWYEIPMPDQSVEGMVSFDAFWAAYDKVQALYEVKRVMKPGANFVFTHWDLLSTDPIPYFESTGMKVVHREETPDWKVYQKKVYAGIEAHREKLVEEMGEGANMFLHELSASPPYLDQSIRRIYHLEAPKTGVG